MISADDKAYRAAEAERLLKEPLLVEALDALEHEAIEAMLAVGAGEASPDDNNKRKAWADQARTVRAVRGRLRQLIAEGKREALQPKRWA